MTKQNNHGGSRKGAGRKAQDAGKGLQRYQVYLDDLTIRKANRYGEGNVSLGLRRLARFGERV